MVNRYVGNKIQSSIKDLFLIAEILGVDPKELLKIDTKK